MCKKKYLHVHHKLSSSCFFFFCMCCPVYYNFFYTFLEPLIIFQREKIYCANKLIFKKSDPITGLYDTFVPADIFLVVYLQKKLVLLTFCLLFVSFFMSGRRGLGSYARSDLPHLKLYIWSGITRMDIPI